MPEVDLTTGTGIGVVVAALGMLVIERLLKPGLKAFCSYDRWRPSAKEFLCAVLLAAMAGVWAWSTIGTIQEVLVAVTVAAGGGTLGYDGLLDREPRKDNVYVGQDLGGAS